MNMSIFSATDAAAHDEPLYVTQTRLVNSLLHSGYDARVLPVDGNEEAVPVTIALYNLELENLVSFVKYYPT